MHNVHMVQQVRVGRAGMVLAANIRRLRKAHRLTFAELSARTEEAGQRIPVLALRRIETGERRVDYDDLLILAIALHVHPVDLMVPAYTNVVPYPIGNQEFGSRAVHHWITDQGDLNQDGEGPRFASPIPYPRLHELDELLDWLPEDRRRQVLRDWVLDQYQGDADYDDEADPEGRHQR
jgi:transcriptional regulator with XRE-family HTH domain